MALTLQGGSVAREDRNRHGHPLPPQPPPLPREVAKLDWNEVCLFPRPVPLKRPGCLRNPSESGIQVAAVANASSGGVAGEGLGITWGPLGTE